MEQKPPLEKLIPGILLNYFWYFGIVILIPIAVSLQHYNYVPPAGSVDAAYNYTHYNNYLIFKQSFLHLIHHQNLYIEYPYEYYDLFKYTPAFALFMAPFAYLPNLTGLILWNVINAFILFYAFWKFPFSGEKKKLFAIGFIVIEAVNSLMHSQSNCLMAGLILLSYLYMENKNISFASFLIILSAFIKPFGLVALCLFLFYPGKWKAFWFSALWFILLLALPLLTVTPHELINHYQSWAGLLKSDHDISYGMSVMSWLHSWFGIDAKFITLFAGIILFMLPLLRYKSYAYKSFRQLFLAFILIWVIIFNHKSESSGYIIAISGVALWFSQSFTKVNLVLLIICFLFTILATSDLYPHFIRTRFFIPYSIKVVPCIIIWVKILFELLSKDFSLGMQSSKNGINP